LRTGALSEESRAGGDSVIGIVPAAGSGQRIQPLGCSKELLPVGSRIVDGIERPKAVSEYVIERMIAAGATQICIVISAEKADIIRYYAEQEYPAEIFYVVQKRPLGLCDALFCAEALASQHDQVLIGLPDTIWFPANAYRTVVDAGEANVSLLLFPVDNPSAFDAVVCDSRNLVTRVEVKVRQPHSRWVWGAITMGGRSFRALRLLWEQRHRRDEYFGSLVNAYIEAGNVVRGCPIGHDYLDVGTLEGYRKAQDFLRNRRNIALARNPAA
jgi:glucose-1-phosphate thymidylyltransferase